MHSIPKLTDSARAVTCQPPLPGFCNSLPIHFCIRIFFLLRKLHTNAHFCTSDTAGGLLQLWRVPVGDLHAGHPDARVPARRARADRVPRGHPPAAGGVHELGPGAAAVSRGAGETSQTPPASPFCTVPAAVLLLDIGGASSWDQLPVSQPQYCYAVAFHGKVVPCQLDTAAAHASRRARAHH
jgi:hypothetical protein